MHKCWYCYQERTLGDSHMYVCVKKIVDDKKESQRVRAMKKALQSSLEVRCPVNQCGEVFKGNFSEIVISSVTHYNRYHKE